MRVISHYHRTRFALPLRTLDSVPPIACPSASTSARRIAHATSLIVDAALLDQTRTPRSSTSPGRRNHHQLGQTSPALEHFARHAGRRHVAEHSAGVSAVARDPPNRNAASLVHARASCAAPCTIARHLARQRRCAARAAGSSRRTRRSSASISARSSQVKNFKYVDHVAIVGVQPELIEVANGEVRAGSSHTAPASVLPNFVPAAVVTSGSTRPCALLARNLANQLDARR